MGSRAARGGRSAAVMSALLLVATVRAEHTIEVIANEAPLLDAPVTAALPMGLVGKALVLRSIEGGEVLAAQADTKDGKDAVTWIVPKLAAKTSAKYVLEQGEASLSEEQGVLVRECPEGLEVKIDGEPFFVYQTKNGPKPYCWPILGPTGKPITRAFPMKRGVPGEAWDHHHHRSLWFTHGKVNGHDFWSETPTSGKTVHQAFKNIKSGPVFGEFTSLVDWKSRKDELVCKDERTIRVYRVPGARLMDYRLRIKASEGPLTFGDDKEGTFGFRVAGTMSINQPKGKPKGTLVNANGDRDRAVWGKRAAWCDYSGMVDGELVGIAIFDSPSNLRHPTYWHARDYGLFCANPFGVGFFTGDKRNDGTHTVPKGEELDLTYRIYMHKGDASEAKVAEHFAAFAHPPSVKVE